MKNNQSANYHKGHDPFISRAAKWITLAQEEYRPVVTYFLTPVQQQTLRQMVGNKLEVTFDGGYPDAQRVVAVLSPYPVEPDYEYEVLVSAYENRFKELSHKDVLGALMHAGLERSFIGDLIVQEDTITIVVKRSLSDFIQQEITSIGRCSVNFQVSDRPIQAVQHFQEIKVQVPSYRLDAMVAALGHCSRSNATQMIRQGQVKVNDIVVEENTQLCNNDFVSVRRVGRFQVMDTISETRKGRLIVRVKQYL